MDARDELNSALKSLVGALDRLGVAWYVGGSVASTVHGRFRATNDIDLVAEIEEQHAHAIAAALAADHYVDERAIVEAVHRKSSFNVIHFDTGLKIDVFIAQVGAFESGVRDRRVRAALGSAADASSIWVVSPEDSILTKLVWFRRGGCVSERQWNDVRGIVEIRGDTLDAAYLQRWASSLGVADLLDDALAGRPQPRTE